MPKNLAPEPLFATSSYAAAIQRLYAALPEAGLPLNIKRLFVKITLPWQPGKAQIAPGGCAGAADS